MKIILVIILGLLYSLCFAPYHYFIFGFISFTGLLLILDKVQTGKKSFLYGWLFGFAHHITGLYWISYSMLVEPDKFAWMIPFSVTVIPAYLAFYIGAVCWMTYRMRMRRTARILFFAAAWTLAEMARGYAFTGFPWNLTGYTLLSQIEVAQAASYISVYGLSMLAILFFCSPYLALRYMKVGQLRPVYKYCISLYYLLPAIIGFAVLFSVGSDKISAGKSKFEKTHVRIVQPNIPQKEKFDPLRIGDHLYKYFNLSLQEIKRHDVFVPDLIVWPEVATSLNFEEDKDFLAQIGDIIPYSAYLILGSLRVEGWMLNKKVFNSIQFIDSEGVVQRMSYDKFHLVPFGEYVPLREYLPGVEKIAKGIGDFNRGTGPKTLTLPNTLPFSPMICYEIIFPGEITDRFSIDRPAWILNLTNDAWFGDSSGPYQHLDAARMRAIEEGLPVIRSANNGVSAAIDAYGRVLQSLNLNSEGVIDTNLPSKSLEPTYYSMNGNQVPLILAGITIILSIVLKYVSRALSKVL